MLFGRKRGVTNPNGGGRVLITGDVAHARGFLTSRVPDLGLAEVDLDARVLAKGQVEMERLLRADEGWWAVTSG